MEEEIKTIYQDDDLLVIDKPAGFAVFSEKSSAVPTLTPLLLRVFPHLKEVGKSPRYGIIHRLDKETSGILLVAKSQPALDFFQKQFKERRVLKKYITLLWGNLKEESGEIKTLIGRAPGNRIKQKAYLHFGPSASGKREAVTQFRVLKRLHQTTDNKENVYTLVEAKPETGRKHQIRTHFAFLKHPVAGDRLYSFKDQVSPKGLDRQFLHASFLEINLFGKGGKKAFSSELPDDLKGVLKNLDEYSK
jgi:23S rRNA pseudouridine1911/1915/1917 synthase